MPFNYKNLKRKRKRYAFLYNTSTEKNDNL